MDNNQFYSGRNQTKMLFQWIGFGCSCLGCLLTVIFSIVTCSRGIKVLEHEGEFGMSKWIIGVIIAVIIAVAGLVLSILSIEKGTKINKIVMVSVIVAFVAIIWAIIPNTTICSYNCMLNDKLKL